MMQKFLRFMYGRYGNDSFNTALLVIAIILSLISSLIYIPIVSSLIYFLCLGCIVFSIFRSFSKNHAARRKELQIFNVIFVPFQKFFKFHIKAFKERKIYKYFKCPKCSQALRAPKGRGSIEVKCQKCHHTFNKKV